MLASSSVNWGYKTCCQKGKIPKLPRRRWADLQTNLSDNRWALGQPTPFELRYGNINLHRAFTITDRLIPILQVLPLPVQSMHKSKQINIQYCITRLFGEHGIKASWLNYQGSAVWFFCKGPESKYCQPGGSGSFSGNCDHSTLLLPREQS